MKHCFTLCTASLAFGLSLSTAALAQPMPPTYPGPAIGVPPYEVVAIVRSAGLEPLHRPLRQGSGGYVLRALDPAGREVRVIVDGHSGRIVKVAPVPGAPQVQPLPPPVYGRPAGRIAVVPDGYGPSSRIPTSPYGLEGPSPYGPDMRLLPNAPGRPPGAGVPPHSAAPAAPPLPKPRPKVAASPATPSVAAPAPAAASPQPAAPKSEPNDGKKEANAAPAPPTTGAAPGPTEFLE